MPSRGEARWLLAGPDRGCAASRRADRVVVPGVQRLLLFQVPADQLFAVACVQAAVRQGRLSPHRAGQYLRPRLLAIAARRWLDQHQLAALAQDKQYPVRHEDRAAAETVLRPAHLARLPVHAAELRPVLLPAVKTVEKAVVVDRRAEVRR